MNKSHINSKLKAARIIFWDFDGVIKDSLDVKTSVFVKMFMEFGTEVSDRVRLHHEYNGGVSRFEKIPLYLSWAGLDATPQLIQQYCEVFSANVVRHVVESPWVPGILNYLKQNAGRQIFILVTATPQAEIERI